MRKRIIVVGDLHCGHVGGLTPPGWRVSAKESPALHDMQVETWKLYRGMVRRHGKFDGKTTIVCNGDAIDGNRNLSELVTADRISQVDMAERCLALWNADNYVFVEGTPYHTGKAENWESVLADRFDADIKPRRYLDVNGRMFFFRHKVGRSTIPYARHTSPAREKTLLELAAGRKDAPEASVFCFSHVHYHTYAGGPGWLVMTLPALQTVSDYGAREFSGQVDWGITVFDVENDGSYTWFTDIRQVESVKEEATRV